MLRRAFLYLSRRKKLQQKMLALPGAARLASQFVAGDTLQEALLAAGKLRQRGFLVSLDHLGENVRSSGEALAARADYLEAHAESAREGLQACIAVKLTQLGLDLSEDQCLANLRPIVEAAAATGDIVEVDMEGSAYTDRTLAIVGRMREEYSSVGVAIQACLRRSEADVQHLLGQGVRIRLVKGAYREPPSIAFQKKSEVDENFLRLMRTLLASGLYHGVATHDARMIGEARSYARSLGLSADQFEFQMLYGIQRGLQSELLKAGCRLRIYIPFGKEWFPYFMRRLAERPANVWFALRSLLR